MQKYLLIILLAPAPFISGCGCVNWLMQAFAPPIPMRTVEAEFGGLEGQTVAVVVFAGPEIQLDYNTAQLEIVDAVAVELCRNVRKVTVIGARRIIRYQDENPRWDTMPPEKLCSVFNADYVLLISLMEFSTRERGSTHLARGRIRADVSAYKKNASAAGEVNPVWQAEPISIVHPPESMGRPVENEWRLRIDTEKLFAMVLVKKFYRHKVPKES